MNGGRRRAAARRSRRCPRTRARPPTRQNGTSAPSAAADRDVGRPRPSAAPRRRRPSRRRARRRAGSACRRDARRARPTSDSALATRLASSAARRRRSGPSTRQARRRRGRSSSMSASSSVTISASMQVVAVVAHAGDPQRQRQLGRAPGARRRPSPSRRAASASRPQSSHVELLGPRCRVDRRRASNGSASTTPASDAAQHLAPLAEAGSHQREQRARVDVATAGGVAPGRSRPAPTRPSAGARTPWPARGRRSRAVAQ